MYVVSSVALQVWIRKYKRAAHIYIHASHKLPERRQPERQKSESPTGPMTVPQDYTPLAYERDGYGAPVVSLPPPRPLSVRVYLFTVLYAVLPLALPLILPLYLLGYFPKIGGDTAGGEGGGIGGGRWKRMVDLYWLVRSAGRRPVQSHPSNLDRSQLAKTWTHVPSARTYVENGALIYQRGEGYCGSATLWCILRSYGGTEGPAARGGGGPGSGQGGFVFPQGCVPELTYGAQDPDKWCANLALAAAGAGIDNLSTTIVRPAEKGGGGYGEFLRSLRRVHDPRCRVAVNYLRPALCGFQRPFWLPAHLLLGLFGGHFSPVVGIIEREGRTEDSAFDDPLVAIFDVNHRYNGLYLVPASMLYEAVSAVDATSGRCRALVVVEALKG